MMVPSLTMISPASIANLMALRTVELSHIANAMRREQAVRAHHPSHTPGTSANAREAQSRP
jgi:hypothetical protein